MTQRAVVVFLGHELVDGAPWWTRWLKPGFVHCFVLIQVRRGWIKIESRYGAVKVTQFGMFDDICAHYRNYGATVVDTKVSEKSLRAPFVAKTCVGLMKSMLGIRSFSLTPWQLYKHLRK